MTEYVHFALDVPATLNRQRRFETGHGAYEMALGPLDFPRRLHLFIPPRGHGTKPIVLQFQYDVAPDEETRAKHLQKEIVIRFGVKSGRVMAVEVPQVATTSFEPVLEVLRNLAHSPSPVLRKSAHYQVMASEVFPTMRPEIETRVAAAM